jgi:DNA replication protein DnaC
MRKFIDEIDKTLIDTVLILGDTGVGKTHLIECMTSYSLGKGLKIKYTTAFNFNQEMLKYHCAKLEEKDEILDPYLSSDILFIDDLGSENKITNVTNEYLYLVINERMQNNKKTVITTNADFAQIQDSYGERIFSRLMHKKQSLKINFTGVDLRIKK